MTGETVRDGSSAEGRERDRPKRRKKGKALLSSPGIDRFGTQAGSALRGATQIQRRWLPVAQCRGSGRPLVLLGRGKGTAAVSGPAPPLSSAPLFVAGLPACGPVLWPKGLGRTRAASLRIVVVWLCSLFCALSFRRPHRGRCLFLGWAISRQSRSPRASPWISISAVARLVAMGTLCSSQSLRI